MALSAAPCTALGIKVVGKNPPAVTGDMEWAASLSHAIIVFCTADGQNAAWWCAPLHLYLA